MRKECKRERRKRNELDHRDSMKNTRMRNIGRLFERKREIENAKEEKKGVYVFVCVF